MMEEIEKLFHSKELEKLFDKIPQLIQFQKFYEEVKYLSNLKDINLQEQFLYEMYEPTLKIAGTSSRAFKNFTKENYDTFTRLKWRWLNSAMAVNPHVEEFKNQQPRA